MHTFTTRAARDNFSQLLKMARDGQPVEITSRAGAATVLISKAEYEAFCAARLAAEFDDIFATHDETLKALADR